MKNNTRFASGRPLDIVCLGRLAVDFYAQQIGARLEDVTSFAKYLGGSSANTAFGCARLGLKAAMASRIGDDAMGRFLVETLAKEGCDVSHVSVDPTRLTGGVVLGIKDRDTFPLIFLRENCADMAVTDADVAAEFLARSKALLITGTHFSTSHVHRVSSLALERARAHDVRTVLDIDYRPVLWGLTARGDGATRFVASDNVTAHLQAILPKFDLVIGTEEEFAIAGGSTDVVAALRAVRRLTAATFVIKRGPLGCAVIDGDVPASLDDAFNGSGVTVEVLNVLGAGDAFNAGFLSGWLRGEDYDACCRYANACGALVVSRHGCAPAMPTRIELDHYIANAERIQQPDKDLALTRLHRVTAPRTPRPELFVFAFDHRDQFFELARGAGADERRIPTLKRLLVSAVAETESARGLQGRVGLLCDDRYGQDALNAATGRGWWIGRPVELPGSNPVVFEHGRSIGTTLIAWPVEHVVKCFVPLHPDDDVVNRLENEAQLRALYDAVQASGHELLVEIVPPKFGPSPQPSPREAGRGSEAQSPSPQPSPREAGGGSEAQSPSLQPFPRNAGRGSEVRRQLSQGPDVLLRAVKRLYNLGVCPEWWKLPPPARDAWPALDALIAERDPYCRGVVLLGLNAPIEELARGFADAAGSRSCRGFAVGRTIFGEPARAWLAGATDDAGLVAGVRKRFEALIDAWQSVRGGDAR